jgi:hypothetical protein
MAIRSYQLVSKKVFSVVILINPKTHLLFLDPNFSDEPSSGFPHFVKWTSTTNQQNETVEDKKPPAAKREHHSIKEEINNKKAYNGELPSCFIKQNTLFSLTLDSLSMFKHGSRAKARVGTTGKESKD